MCGRWSMRSAESRIASPWSTRRSSRPWPGHRLDNPLDLLSDREREVLALMAEGLSNQGISDRLYLSTKTVEGHVGSIMTKLQLTDSRDENRRVLAVLKYLRR